MDVLADVLAVSGVRGTLGSRIDAGADWGWWAPRTRDAAFHAVTAGTAWLAVPGHEAVELMPGDVVLLPRGVAHAIASDPVALARTDEGTYDGFERTGVGTTRMGRGPTRTQIVCAHYSHDPVVTTQVLETLPDVVHLRAHDGGPGLQDTVRLLGRELADPQLAGTVVLDRLVDILLIQLLRVWLADSPAPRDGCWLRVLRDPVIGAAVARIHDDPSHPWTTGMLAAEVSVSRATLARRFPELVGETPAAYLTRWRMDLAARRLRDTDDPIDTVAEGVGYASVPAFSRAFSRARGQAPGRFRTTSRAA
ncbi:AraC family transcriptional regulator [Patulibacter sp.]|uniref:AraC family transcriptional regulator n=1 Tax=Patulibacter sp. TaxID=1912859 RepID=UPI002716C7E8|nr:AraC family transcriptional regulator [Patulibacter sp.]MDO9410825.1 AraC family transcriptional regulator [Patulibacter sp.]